MNILVLCDEFAKGGLETHISSYAAALQNAHTTWLACAHYEPTGLWDDARVCTDFHFSFYDTVRDLQEDVDRLCAIIREKQIDVLHVHPWFCLYAACFAAAKTGVKLVTTVHGFVSLSYHANLYDELWMEDIFTNAVGHAFCVSQMGLDMLATMHMRRASLLPNAVDLSRFRPVQPAGNRRWALVSRLDRDKFAAVEALMQMLPELEIDAVDVYGDGSCMEQAQALAAACEKPVRLMGHCSDLHERLRSGYCGVIGLGRCAVEALALGLPVLFAGYGKLCGMIDRRCYARAAALNFVTETFPALDADELNTQLRQVYADPSAYCFAEQIRADFDVSVCAEQMAAAIAGAPVGMPQYCALLYEKLLALPAETAVHASEAVFQILRDTLLGQTRNLYLKMQLLQNQLTERKREETAYQLRLAWNDMDRRHRATQAALDEQVRLRTEQHLQAQAQLDALGRQLAALTASNAALNEALRQAQEENAALVTRMDTLTLGYLIRQWFRWKILRPLQRLFGKGA